MKTITAAGMAPCSGRRPKAGLWDGLLAGRPQAEQAVDLLGSDGEIVDPHAYGVVDRVGDGRRGGNVGKLADGLALEGGRSLALGEKHGLKARDVPAGGQLEVAEVERLDVPFRHGHVLHDAKPEPLNDAAVYLPLVCDRVQDGPDVVDGDQALD